VRDALRLVGLEELHERATSELSGGQQQRVALARAIVVRPRVLLFDEPLSNLDARLRIQMRGEIQRLQKRLGITAVYVTHDQEEAMAISDRIAVMHQGVIVQEGRLDALLGRERITIVPGDTLLVPAGTAHGFLNRYEKPARVLFVFPSHQVEQVRVSVPGTTTGFPSERGLSGYESPQDRPREKRS
jgi:energy-coupling factor transporter ATP-binding protein EcfA2